MSCPIHNVAFVANKKGRRQGGRQARAWHVPDPALGGIASPRSVVPEAERVCRSSDRNTSVSLARLRSARGRAPSRQGPATCALMLTRMGTCRAKATLFMGQDTRESLPT